MSPDVPGNVDPALFLVPTQAALHATPPSTHPPRILLLYGSLRERKRLAVAP